MFGYFLSCCQIYRLIVCYISPYHGAESTEHLKTFIASIESIIHCDASIVLMGDFNFPDIRWCKNDLSPIQCSRQDSLEFANFIQRYAFLQYVTDPTRLNKTATAGPSYTKGGNVWYVMGISKKA